VTAFPFTLDGTPRSLAECCNLGTELRIVTMRKKAKLGHGAGCFKDLTPFSRQARRRGC